MKLLFLSTVTGLILSFTDNCQASDLLKIINNTHIFLFITFLLIIVLSTISVHLFNIKLKQGIKKRTEELAKANETLSKEIIERKASENRENENFDRYKITFEQAAEAIILTNANGKILDFNNRAHESLGYSRIEFAQLTIYDFEIGRSKLEIKQGMIKALKEGGAEYETRLKTKDGKIRDFQIKSRTIRLRGEICFQSLWNDVTERKINEKKLLKREKQLRELVAKTPYPLCIIDSNNYISLLNEKFTQTFGYTLNDVENLEEWWEKTCPHKHKGLWLETIKKVHLSNREIAPQEWPLICKNGDKRSVEFRVVNLGDISLIAMQDLTTSKELEDNLRIAKDKAEEANLAKTEFLANMSHEIRTPLNGVMGMLQLVQLTELNEEQKHFIDTGIFSARSLLRILADILDLSKIESGKLDIEMSPFSIRMAIKPVIDSFSQEISRKKLDFSYEIWPEIPEYIVGDQVRIRQILYNLVGNAIKFTEEGSVRLEIYPLLYGQSNKDIYIHFAVIDTGIGIKDDKIKLIFDSFTQADSSHTRRYGGTGLGLSMVKRLVGLMNGSIDISSEFGIGTEIHVTLKLGLSSELPHSAATVYHEEKRHAPEHNNAVLLVEDERINQMAISKLLEKHGFNVTCADDGAQALEILLKQPFSCVLMDIQMPVLNGIQATKKIRTDPEFKSISKIPIIALTAHAMSGDREKFIESGMDNYLPKPVDADNLISLLLDYSG